MKAIKVFLASNNDGSWGEGRTLEEAYTDLQEATGHSTVEDTCFYEAMPIEVEMKLIPKLVKV